MKPTGKRSYLTLEEPFLQQDKLPDSSIWTICRLFPAECSHYPVCVTHNQLAASITICRWCKFCSLIHNDKVQKAYNKEGAFTNVADEDDFGIGRDMLSKQGLLVIKWHEFMLTGGIDFICIDCTQVKEVKPPLSTNSDHKVLAKQNKTDKHNDLTIHIAKIFMFCLCNL